MKRIFVLFIALITIISLFALPISAEEAITSDSEQSIEETAESKNFFEKAGDFFKSALDYIGFSDKFFNWEFISINTETIKATLLNGGFNYIGNGSEINKIIDAVYQVLYPIGFAIMLICWALGMVKSGVSTALDIKDKNSIIHSVISLIIGLAAMSLAPQILTVLTSASQWLCNSIFNQTIFTSFIQTLRVEGITAKDIISSTSNEVLFTTIVLFVVDLIFMLNILWIALLQCLSPIFIGLMANDSTRKISFNFIKEYFKALLVPSVTLIYFFLAISLTGVTHAFGLIVALVLAISTLGIAGKKLDKLIN